MRYSWFLPILCAVAAAPVLAVSLPASDELQANRRLLQRWRGDPEHYARLKHDYRAFVALSPEKRERLRALDHDLHEEDAISQAHLLRVLDRYATWLEHLSEDDRARVDAATDGADRLHVVKELREREWIAHLPRADRDRIDRAAAEDRDKIIEEVRNDEHSRRRKWQTAFASLEEPGNRSVTPEHLHDFPSETRMYYFFTLLPSLGGPERERVRQADGKWPDLARVLLDLSQRHGMGKVPPGQWEGPRNLYWFKDDDLPKELRELKSFRPKAQGSGPNRPDQRQFGKLRETTGKWPDFALALHDLAEAKGWTLKPVGPCTLKDFQPPVQRFYEKNLGPELAKETNKADLEKLDNAQGKWPDYPFAFMELAKKCKMKVPGTYLGGPSELWNAARGE